MTGPVGNPVSYPVHRSMTEFTGLSLSTTSLVLTCNNCCNTCWRGPALALVDHISIRFEILWSVFQTRTFQRLHPWNLILAPGTWDMDIIYKGFLLTFSQLSSSYPSRYPSHLRKIHFILFILNLNFTTASSSKFHSTSEQCSSFYHHGRHATQKKFYLAIFFSHKLLVFLNPLQFLVTQ